ncbi:hypothetical protein EC968_000577 [Mortierella alpina]|nr:hypothetical protein EC968_000577 [Mortierella alpina]
MAFTLMAVAFFARYKHRTAFSDKRLLVLGIACFSAMLLGFYAGQLFSLAQTEDSPTLLYFGAGLDVALTMLLLIECVLASLYNTHLNSKRAPSSTINFAANGNIHATGTLQEPLPVHVYQTRHSLTPSETTSLHHGTTTPISDNSEARQQAIDAVELEELPKYERVRPAQHARIVDMANFGTVNLRSGSSFDVTNHHSNGFEQGQESRWELRVDLSTVEAPQHSPSSHEIPAETPSLIDSPAPSYNPTTQLAPFHSESSAIVTLPMPDAPAGPPTALPADAPSIVTSAPPVYAP